MSYYRTCPGCGAHLDPGEQCDCRASETAVSTANAGGVDHTHEKAALSAANTQGGRIGQTANHKTW